MLVSVVHAGNTVSVVCAAPVTGSSMPLPLAHSLAGATIQVGLDRNGRRPPWAALAAAVVLANAPDFDLLPGILLGDPNRFHHGATHSFVTAFVVGVAWAWWFRRHPRPALGALGRGGRTTVLLVTLLWGSHVFLDLLTHDPSPPQGVPALWPLLEQRFHLYDLFARADKVAGPATPLGFVASLLTSHNLRALAGELILLAPVYAVVAWWRTRSAAT